ncbi:hypothetical protein ACQP0C_22675 [Nocardia sp. CA-129566]|uniref:hypothetical protein n=1 Tax=Nocardia sp. CA-129566 TaxID=3239976 RepID=UPI003D953FEC
MLLLLGIVGVALTLTATGYGFEGWAIFGAIASTLLLAIGTLIVLAEHRRIKAHEGRDLSDPGGHRQVRPPGADR